MQTCPKIEASWRCLDSLGSQPLGLGIQPAFPIFQNSGPRLCYLDSAASSQKPQVVVDRLQHYLCYEHANIHRGAYELSACATQEYDLARDKVARFVNAPSSSNIVFTKGSTEAINLVATSYGEQLSPGSGILLSLLEHHSNIVPWQLLAKRRNLPIEFVDIDQDTSLDLNHYQRKLELLKPEIVAITFISNAFGTVNPIKEVVQLAHQHGAKVLLDASQVLMHRVVDVQELDVDFMVFTGHKMYGPTGIGALYAKLDLLEAMEPYQAGGDMIEQVTVEGSTWAEVPRKFEAGTPPIAEAIAFGTAIDFLVALGLDRIAQYEAELFDKAFDLMSRQEGVKLYGPATSGKEQASIISFQVDGVHPHDLATIADSSDFNVQIRAGHHCAMPAMKTLGIWGTARASIGLYNDISDFESLTEAVRYARKMMA